jgi:hypothetical protein
MTLPSNASNPRQKSGWEKSAARKQFYPIVALAHSGYS